MASWTLLLLLLNKMLAKLSVCILLSCFVINLGAYTPEKVEIPPNVDSLEIFTDESIQKYDGSDVSIRLTTTCASMYIAGTRNLFLKAMQYYSLHVCTRINMPKIPLNAHPLIHV